MPQEVLDASLFSPDILEFISLLNRHRVRYLLVGGEAVIFHGHIRLTGDVNFFYEASVANAEKLHAALADFWGPEIPGVADPAELLQKGQIIQFGMPPNRIDLINLIDGVEFDDAWPTRTVAEIDVGDARVPVLYIGLQHLIRNKRAAARPKDLEDLRFLSRALEQKKP